MAYSVGAISLTSQYCIISNSKLVEIENICPKYFMYNIELKLNHKIEFIT